MATNQSRRDAAKRKLERQLAARAEASRKQRQRLTIGGIIAVLVVGGGIAWLVTRPAASTADSGSSTATDAAPVADPCSYVTDGVAPAAKEASVPGNVSPLNTGTVEGTLTLNGTAVPITLDRASAPCGVNSFLSLASQGFYDDTDCWRLTDADGLKILQCGDPSGTGTGGPGYGFESETPEGGTATYPRGTVALANASAANTTGSQFFIAYDDSVPVSPAYSVIGSIAEDNLTAIDEIAEAGLAAGLLSGTPEGPAHIDSITVPEDALEGTGTYAPPSPEPSMDLGGLDMGDLSGLESVPTG